MPTANTYIEKKLNENSGNFHKWYKYVFYKLYILSLNNTFLTIVNRYRL